MGKKKYKKKLHYTKKPKFVCPSSDCTNGRISHYVYTNRKKKTVFAVLFCNKCNLRERIEYKDWYNQTLSLELFDTYGDLIDMYGHNMHEEEPEK